MMMMTMTNQIDDVRGLLRASIATKGIQMNAIGNEKRIFESAELAVENYDKIWNAYDAANAAARKLGLASVKRYAAAPNAKDAMDAFAPMILVATISQGKRISNDGIVEGKRANAKHHFSIFSLVDALVNASQKALTLGNLHTSFGKIFKAKAIKNLYDMEIWPRKK